jgi:hypothetical protein
LNYFVGQELLKEIGADSFCLHSSQSFDCCATPSAASYSAKALLL